MAVGEQKQESSDAQARKDVALALLATADKAGRGSAFWWRPGSDPKAAPFEGAKLLAAGDIAGLSEMLSTSLEAGVVDASCGLSEGQRAGMSYADMLAGLEEASRKARLLLANERAGEECEMLARASALCARCFAKCLTEAKGPALDGLGGVLLSAPQALASMRKACPQAGSDAAKAFMGLAPKWILVEPGLFEPWARMLSDGAEQAKELRASLAACWPEGSWLGEAIAAWMGRYGQVAHAGEKERFEKGVEKWQRKERGGLCVSETSIERLQAGLASGIRRWVGFGLETGLLDGGFVDRESGRGMERALAGLDKVKGEAASAVEAMVMEAAIGWGAGLEEPSRKPASKRI